jgi:hypothetical protein
MKHIFTLFRSTFLTFFLTIVIFSSISAQSGKISGRITDAATDEPLPFVNIIVMGTMSGAASDIDGYYSILNIKPGTYEVKASAIGYQSKTIQTGESIN